MTVQPITLTDAAAKHVKNLLSQSMPSPLGLRIGVKPAGCNGIGYVLEFATEHKPGENVFEDKDIKLFIAPHAMLFLTGVEMDFREGTTGGSFVFNNPNTSHGGD
ncbi:MAG: iron-sulfur cluster assembly accessory protein [Alphaproteobacteria bacterium]|nr:iron-sulfur cluster assembly accessory protein [Alphaproteobacteria bacterium]